MRVRVPATLPLLLVAGLALPASADALIYRWPKDKALRYTFKKKQKISYKGDSGKVVESEVGENKLEFAAAGNSYSGLRLRVRYRELKSQKVSPERSYKFNSRKKYSAKAIAGEPALGVLLGMIGDGFTVDCTRRGKMQVTGFPALVERAASRGLTGSMGEVRVAAMLMRSLFSDKQMQDGLSAVFIELPADVVAGDQWPLRLASEFAGIGVVYDLTCTCKSLKKGKATIAIGGLYKLVIDGQEIPKHGSVSGSAAFDNKEGRLVFSKLTAALKLPNVSMSSSYEIKFDKVLDAEDAGPESFEKKLRGSQTLIGRCTAKGIGPLPTPIHKNEACKTTAFYACKGDLLRIIEKKEGRLGGTLKVVDALGRAGWVKAFWTVPTK